MKVYPVFAFVSDDAQQERASGRLTKRKMPLLFVLASLGLGVALSACGARTTRATDLSASSAKLHATAHCDQGETCTWYWEYWPATQPRSASSRTPVSGPVGPTSSPVRLTEPITGLQPHTTYRWVFCGSNDNGALYACAGPRGILDSTTADPPSDYGTLTTAAWSIQPTPTPPDATTSGLSGVTCTSVDACVAVGSYRDVQGTYLTLAERWDGTSWTIQSTPDPAGATGSSLADVSCTSSSACTAVGFSNIPTIGSFHPVETTLAERWDGTSWTTQNTPPPGGAQYSLLADVSCPSTTSCTAVGSSSGGTLAEAWNGTTWAIQSTPNPDGGGSSLSAVSCRSPKRCMAVGDGNPALAERWDGTTWTVQPTPLTPATISALNGVWCPTAKHCTAVGGYFTSFPNTQVPLAEAYSSG